MLRRNSTLRELTLSDNSIREDGARALALALASNTTLRMLDMRLNGLSQDAKDVLCDARARREAPLDLPLAAIHSVSIPVVRIFGSPGLETPVRVSRLDATRLRCVSRALPS
jgi:hypothetical protein